MKIILILSSLMMLSSCNSDFSYTLYRDSAIEFGSDMRVHVASFDSHDGEDYNRQNCNIAQQLFQQQPGVTVKYWCEKGIYKK